MAWQTRDKLFDVPKAERRPQAKAKPELPLTPRPGEALRWCAHDKRLLYELSRPDVQATLSAEARAFVAQLQQLPTVTLEQVGWLRGLARRVSFRDVKAVAGKRRAIDLRGDEV